MKLRYVLAVMFAFITAASQAQADATAVKDYACQTGSFMNSAGQTIGNGIGPDGIYYQKQNYCGEFDRLVGERLIVYITPSSEDLGRPGAYYIGVRRNEQDVGIFSAAGQWVAHQGGLYEPTARVGAMAGSTRSFLVIDKRMICAVAGGGKLELWAGYGILHQSDEERVTRYHNIANPNIPPDHVRNLYIQTDMIRNEKYWNVHNEECNTVSEKY